MNPFSGLVENEPGPFSAVQLPEAIETPPPPLARFRQAQVAAAANLDLSSDNVMASYESTMANYEKTIAETGDFNIRLQAASTQQARNVENILRVTRTPPEFDPDGSLRTGAVQAANLALTEDLNNRAQYALEQEAVDHIMDLAATDRHQADLLLNLMEVGSPIDQIRDMNTKYMILQREIDKAQFEQANQPWFRDIADFALSMLPLNASMGQVGNVNGTDVATHWYDNLMSGERRSQERAALWNMPVDQFSDYIRDELLPNLAENSTLLGYHDKSEQLNLLTGLRQTPNALFNNAGNVLDNVGLLAPLGKAASLPTSLLRMGGRRASAAAMGRAATALVAEGTEEAVQRAGLNSVDDLVDNMLPAAVNPVGHGFAVTPSSMAHTILERGRRLTDELPRIIQTGRFADTAEQQRAIDTFVDKLTTEAFDNRVVDVDSTQVVRYADNTQVRQVAFTLGNRDGTGLATEELAGRLRDNLEFKGAELVRGEDGQWFVKVVQNMPETGTYTNPLAPKTSNVYSRFLLGARQRSDPYLANRAQVSENARSRMMNDVTRVLARDMRIDPASRERLGQLWLAGDNEARWWTADEANMLYQRTFGRDISEREWTAYNRMRDINDVEYTFRNENLHKERVLQGRETVSITTPLGQVDRMNAVVDRNFTKPIRGRAYNATTNIMTDEPLTAEQIRRMIDDGYMAVHLDDPMKLGDHQIGTVFAKRSDFNVEPLRMDQLGYRAGGHRIYEEKYFAKQTSMGRQPGINGAADQEFLSNPATFMVGSKAQVDAWVEVMEQARDIALRNGDVGELDRLFAGRPGFPNADEFLQGVTDGTYRTDFKFETRFDRELPADYDGAANLSFVNNDEDGIIGFLRTQGRMYYGRKGDKLPDWQGEQAPTLDAFKTLDRSLRNIANLTTFSDYKITSVERWLKSFESYIDNSSVSGYRSNIDKFLNAKPIPGAQRDRVLQAMEDQRDIIKRNIGWKTDIDRAMEEQTRRLSEFVIGRDPTSVRHGASRIAINWLSEQNPLQALRGWAFDLKLGLLNPVQLFLQANSVAAITALEPRFAMKGIQSAGLLRFFLTGGEKRGIETLEAMVRKGAHKVAGFEDPEDFKAFMSSAKASGFFSIGDTHSMVNAAGPTSVTSFTGSKIQDVRQAGRFFFQEGEGINRMVAYRAAWERTKVKFGDKIDDIEAFEFLNEVAGQAETLSFSMSRSSQAWWQQGLASIPTQFFSYQARMLEMMLGSQTTLDQKLRLVLSQAFLYGAAGLPAAPFISDMIKEKTGTAPEVGTIPGWIDRGFMDNMWFAMSGQDIMLSDRLGSGSWLPDTINSLLGNSRYGETSVVDVLGGASVSTAADLFETIGPVLKYMALESGGDSGMPLTNEALQKLAMNVSSYSVTLRAMMVANYGIYKTRTGMTIATDVPNESAWSILMFGAQPGAVDQLQARMDFLKNRSETIDEAAKVVENYRVDMLNQPERVDEIGLQVNAFINLLDPSIRQEVLKRAHANVDPSLYASAAERFEKVRLQREAARNMETNQ